jgi:hypothetical protein
MKFILWALCLVAMLRPVADLRAQINPYKEAHPASPATVLKYWPK